MLRARASSPPAGWGSWCAATASSIGSLKSYSYFFPCIGGVNCSSGLCGLVLTLHLFLLSLQEAFEDTAAAAGGRFCCCQTHGVFLTCREEEEGWRNGVKDDNGAGGGLRAVILMVIWFLQTLVGMKWHQAKSARLAKTFFSPSSSGSLCPFGCPALFVWTLCSYGGRQPSVFCFFSCSALTLQTLLSFCSPQFVFLTSVRCRWSRHVRV